MPVRHERCTWTQWVFSAHYIQRARQRRPRPRAINCSRRRSATSTIICYLTTCRTVATKERSFKNLIWILSGLKFLSILGLPWWLSDKESACQCRRQGFSPWSERIPHAAESLRPWANPTCHNYCACGPKSHAPQQEMPLHWEANTHQRRAAPLTASREKPKHQQRSRTATNINI